MRKSLPGIATGLFLGIFTGVIIGRSSTGDNPPVGNHPADTQSDQNCQKYKDMYDRLRIGYLAVQEEKSKSQTVTVCPESPVLPGKTDLTQEKPTNIPDESAPPTQEDLPESDANAEDPIAKVQLPEKSSPNEEATAIIASIKSIEKEMANTNSPDKKLKFLDRVKLATPMQTTDSMPPVTAKNKYFENIYGIFKASIQFTDTKRSNGRITLVIKKPEDPDDKKAWEIRVDVDDGKGNVSRQQGGLEMLRSVSDQSFAYLLRSSETSYLQLFYRSSSDLFLGNYYEKNGAGDYPKRGTFWLKRQDR